MYIFFSILTFIFGFVFIYLKTNHPATIWIGITFTGFVFGVSFLLLSLFIDDNLFLFRELLSLFTLFLFLFALFIVGLFIFNGIKLIRLEGFEFSNTLSLLTGIGSLLYFVLWPILFDLTKSGWLNITYRFFSMVIVYFAFVFFLYTVSNLLQLVHLKQTPIDYFIVLGAALDGAEVSPILAGRIDKAIDLQNKQSAGKLIFTGGQGSDELKPEGKAMAEYALDQGVHAKFILKETKSTSTEENIRLSKIIIEADWKEIRSPVIALVTNNYHILRALMIANEQELKCIGYGSFSKFYYSLNAFLREYVAYLVMTYKVHFFIVSLLIIIRIIFI